MSGPVWNLKIYLQPSIKVSDKPARERILVFRHSEPKNRPLKINTPQNSPCNSLIVLGIRVLVCMCFRGWVLMFPLPKSLAVEPNSVQKLV
jgi:hypothetical protein